MFDELISYWNKSLPNFSISKRFLDVDISSEQVTINGKKTQTLTQGSVFLELLSSPI